MLSFSAVLSLVFNTRLGRIGAAAFGLGLLIVWFAADQRARGRKNVVSNINHQAAVQVDKALADRAGVADGGSAEWLRKYSCRDC